MRYGAVNGAVIDVSAYDDMYELLAGCNAVLTDYSSVVFDGITMEIPTFLYVSDYEEYVKERGRLVWDIENLPVKIAKTEVDLRNCIEKYDDHELKGMIARFKEKIKLHEKGDASQSAVNYIMKIMEVV